MPIKMVRIDDRLIHGQIVAAWVKSQGIKRKDSLAAVASVFKS